jgi:hypothetical protein
MKPFTAYPEAFQRATIAAHCGEYRASYSEKAEAHAAVRLLQKYAAAVRRDPAAPLELRFACADREGGVLWHLPKLENGSWIILGHPRGKAKVTLADVAARLV